MSAPIASVVGVALEPPSMPVSASSDAAETVPFDVTLGAAIAVGLPVTLAAIPVAAPEPLLELILDGEWLPDEPVMSLEANQPADDRPTNEPAAASGEPMVLEKNLDSWLAAFGRRERANPQSGDGLTDPHLVRLDEPETVEAPDQLTTVIPSIGVHRLWPVETAVLPVVQPQPTGDAIPADRPVADIEIGIDNDRSAARPRLMARPISRPTVEIGGFDFPSFPDQVEAALRPTIAPAAARAAGFAVPVPQIVDIGPSDMVAMPPADRVAIAPDLVAPVQASAREQSAPTDLLAISAQSGGTQGRLGDGLTQATVEAAARPGPVSSSHEPRPFGPNGAAVARAVFHQTGGEPSPDSRTSDRRSQGDHSAEQSEPVSRRRPIPEAPTFEPRSVAGRGPTVAEPASAQSLRPVDTPVLAAPAPLDRIARRMDHLTLDLKDDAGDFGRLRVSMSGPLVRATIMPNDPAMADRLNLEIRQLKMNLQERGFPEPRLTVQSPKVTEPVSWVPAGREAILDIAAPGQPNTQRRGNDDDRRDRWTASRDQRRDEQHQQEQARHPRRDHSGDPK